MHSFALVMVLVGAVLGQQAETSADAETTAAPVQAVEAEAAETPEAAADDEKAATEEAPAKEPAGKTRAQALSEKLMRPSEKAEQSRKKVAAFWMVLPTGRQSARPFSGLKR